MTPAQVADVQQSFATLAPTADAFTAAFYRELFVLAPGLRAMFPAELGAQRAKLAGMLAVIVHELARPDELHARFRALGERHAGYGVRQSHYDAVGAALLKTLHGALGDETYERVEAAWATLYAELAEAMIVAGEATIAEFDSPAGG